MNSEKESTYSTVLKKIGQSIIIDRKKLSQCSVDRERRESRGIRKKKISPGNKTSRIIAFHIIQFILPSNNIR